MDKIYTFPNTEEARQKSIKTLESLLNIYQGTLFEHLLPLFVVGTLFTEPDMNTALERINTINKVLAKSLRELRKRINKFIPHLKNQQKFKYNFFCNSPKIFLYSPKILYYGNTKL